MNYYSAQRDIRPSSLDRPVSVITWRGWMQYGGTGPIVWTPGSYATQREAVAAIKAQHPQAQS